MHTRKVRRLWALNSWTVFALNKFLIASSCKCRAHRLHKLKKGSDGVIDISVLKREEKVVAKIEVT